MGASDQVKILSYFLSAILLAAICNPAGAAEEKQLEYSKKGADTCLKCHDEDNEYPVLPIFKTAHGEANDSRSPMAILQCETCHGPAGEHPKRVREGEVRPPIRAFGRNAWTPLAEQNAVCLRCHDDTPRINWHGGAHETGSVGCSDCHQVHSRRDPMKDAGNQVEKCNQCHLRQKAEFNRRSSHPVRFEKMRCSDCHNPHGTFGDKLIGAASRTDLCLRCHAEKRGPVLWPHAPVLEDCTICHYPHGSFQAALLIKKPPLLCQQCHNNAGHPSTVYSGDGLSTGSNASQRRFLLGKGCLNCHSQIHGSNHPSGVKLMR
jgi:DmsE family decaheme c-type cytochrome